MTLDEFQILVRPKSPGNLMLENSIVIIGGGVIDLCTAYYRAQKGHPVIVVELLRMHSPGIRGGR